MAHSTLEMNDPFAMLKPLIDEVINLYDRSVWRVRDAIRVIERVSTLSATYISHTHMIDLSC